MTRSLGLENLVSGVVGAVENVVQTTVTDPLFGGNVVKANSQSGDTEVRLLICITPLAPSDTLKMLSGMVRFRLAVLPKTLSLTLIRVC